MYRVKEALVCWVIVRISSELLIGEVMCIIWQISFNNHEIFFFKWKGIEKVNMDTIWVKIFQIPIIQNIWLIGLDCVVGMNYELKFQFSSAENLLTRCCAASLSWPWHLCAWSSIRNFNILHMQISTSWISANHHEEETTSSLVT